MTPVCLHILPQCRHFKCGTCMRHRYRAVVKTSGMNPKAGDLRKPHDFFRQKHCGQIHICHGNTQQRVAYGTTCHPRFTIFIQYTEHFLQAGITQPSFTVE